MENMCVAAMDGMRGIHASLLSMFFCHGRTRDVEGERRKGNGGDGVWLHVDDRMTIASVDLFV